MIFLLMSGLVMILLNYLCYNKLSMSLLLISVMSVVHIIYNRNNQHVRDDFNYNILLCL